MSPKIILTGLLILLISCNKFQKKPTMATKPLYKEGFIQTDRIKLHYLDWGGSGQPLVLLHGLGDSPYIFEGIAKSLKENFRIIAYSKRGHCKSETTDSLYDNSSLVSDLKLLLDSLNIKKANLLGWSMAGNEITEFAIQYPDRTNRLIYFEGGYDMSDESFSTIYKTVHKFLQPDSIVLQSLDAYRDWYHNSWYGDIEWNPIIEANLIASTLINPDGSVTTIPNNHVFKLLLESAMNYHRDYEKIQTPALAIYTNSFFYPPGKDDGIVNIYKNMEENIINPWRQSSIIRIKSELKDVTIKEMPGGTHTSLIFLDRDFVIESINSFLLE
jgi:pimeloyl-ACP methyl ester carboxylesterase